MTILIPEDTQVPDLTKIYDKETFLSYNKYSTIINILAGDKSDLGWTTAIWAAVLTENISYQKHYMRHDTYLYDRIITLFNHYLNKQTNRI